VVEQAIKNPPISYKKWFWTCKNS